MIDLPAGVELVLASGSPRRRELLGSVGLHPVVRPADVDETPIASESPTDYVLRLAHAKAARGFEIAAAAVSSELGATDAGPTGTIVIAADTTVEIDGSILEKPVDRRDAERMLRLLSGRTHRCHTAVAVGVGGIPGLRDADAPIVNSRTVTTEVRFVALDDAAIEWYLETGEADDKAGAYGIQGAAGAFVEAVDGSVTNVIGLPLAETLDLLRDAVSGPARS